MQRPDVRPFSHLPVLESRRNELETCTYCPKLCRDACPVSQVEPRESLTPWGKMSSTAHHAARASDPLDGTLALPWACTGCLRCRDACAHQNDVAGTLLDARAALFSKGQVPEGVREFLRNQPLAKEAQERTRTQLRTMAESSASSRTGLLIGCSYLQHSVRESHAIVRALAGLRGHAISLMNGCCGLPYLLAGARDAFVDEATQLGLEGLRFDRIVVADPSCAALILRHYPRLGISFDRPPRLLLDEAHSQLGSLRTVGPLSEEPIRYHDPCVLSRDLERRSEPRVVLSKILGRAPEEFSRREAMSACSGGGGLLRHVYPTNAAQMAERRLSEHEHLGGGRVVTACGQSLQALRRSSHVSVDDLATWIARSIENPPPAPAKSETSLP